MIRAPQDKATRLQRGENQRIFSQMRRHFAPASIVPAPQSIPQQTGNRNTVLTAGNSANSQATDSAQLQLSSGTVTWYYKTKFNSPPNVTASAVADFPNGSGASPAIFLKGPGTKVAVVIVSADLTDNRVVNLHAVGTPN